MDVYIGIRQSGKSSAIKRIVRERKRLGKDTTILIPNLKMGIPYGKYYSIITPNTNGGNIFQKMDIIIDEPEFMDYDYLRTISRVCNIIAVFGTPMVRDIGERSWLKQQCEQHGYYFYDTVIDEPEFKESAKQQLMPEVYMTEYEGSFVFRAENPKPLKIVP